MEDELFGNIKAMPKELAILAALTPDAYFWDLFNSGFATHTAIDGYYIFDNTNRKVLKTKAGTVQSTNY